MTASDYWYRRATSVTPGGVNSPVRAHRAVGGAPFFIASASGPYVETVDGQRLIDFIASWGALLFGHARPEIVAAVREAAGRGTSYGMPTPGEVELAELIVALVPSVEMVRLVNSGTEAAASAIRVARAATGRSGIVKFEGCYHGHADPFLVAAGSGPATLGVPSSPGVPADTVANTRLARFNDPSTVEEALSAGDIAAVIVEPVAGNMGLVPPAPGFLEALRSACDRHGAVLIFDEVMTGFRVARGGAQERYGVMPDLTCLGKVVAGGAPAAAYGGRADLMRLVAPEGPVYQAGTLAGNPLAVAAGLVCLQHLKARPEVYDALEALGARLEAGLRASLTRHGIPGCVQRVGAMLTVFFGPSTVSSWDDAATADRERFAAFFHGARQRGVMLPPSQFEAWFVMEDHGAVLEETVAALDAALAAM